MAAAGEEERGSVSSSAELQSLHDEEVRLLRQAQEIHRGPRWKVGARLRHTDKAGYSKRRKKAGLCPLMLATVVCAETPGTPGSTKAVLAPLRSAAGRCPALLSK